MILLPTLGVLATFGKPRASGDDPRLTVRFVYVVL